MEEAEEKDLNETAEETPVETGQLENETETQTEETQSEETPQTETEDVSALKERLLKAERDRDNYREGLLKVKKSIEPEKEEKAPAKETSVERAVQSALEKRNEQDALETFKEKYPALKDEARLNQVMVNLPSNVDKGSVKGVLKALEGALVLTRHYTGKKVEDAGVDLSELGTVGKRGSKSTKDDTPDVAESTIVMGQRFKHSAEKLANVDDGPGEVKIV